MKPIVWRKLGRILDPADGPPWRSRFSGMVSTLPLPDGGYRLFLSGIADPDSAGERDRNKRRIGWVDLDADFNVVGENPDNPVLPLGEPGHFDCNGMCMPMVVPVSDSTVYMYYVSWGPGTGCWLDNRCGLAISEDYGRTWRRRSHVPLPLVDDNDPIGIGTVFVSRDAPDRWRLWYTSFDRLVPAEQGYDHYYHIRYAEGEDGIHWRKPADNVAMDFADADEQAVARPMVLREPDGYRMWFCKRQFRAPYRIGYAESPDGRTWTRKPSGIEPSESGWDSEMVEYAWVVRRGDEYVMFYNGNGYGQTGTGVAIGTLAE